MKIKQNYEHTYRLKVLSYSKKYPKLDELESELIYGVKVKSRKLTVREVCRIIAIIC